MIYEAVWSWVLCDFHSIFFQRKTNTTKLRWRTSTFERIILGGNHATFDINATNLMSEITGMAVRKLAQDRNVWSANRKQKLKRNYWGGCWRETNTKTNKSKVIGALRIEEMKHVFQGQKRTNIFKFTTFVFEPHNVHLVLRPVTHHRQGAPWLRSLPRAPFTYILVPQAVDEGVQHEGDHSVHYRGKGTSLGRMSHIGTEIDPQACLIEQGDHTEVRPTGGKCFIFSHCRGDSH